MPVPWDVVATPVVLICFSLLVERWLPMLLLGKERERWERAADPPYPPAESEKRTEIVVDEFKAKMLSGKLLEQAMAWDALQGRRLAAKILAEAREASGREGSVLAGCAPNAELDTVRAADAIERPLEES
eukprot:gnl/TRDRNA2_/TRDRNA2_132989_c0_seq1.p2 gnl/TRDRNA2_/TRDRNA2_132989_c0~~gnl/TRDRNA2_/TRDRNA2_132989_c0_seq1.p2  ORF type:complete len:130 (+),score=32.96 gnl/TRDRNA2_/TRDRNA2_132989_c0_seq1:37-426(+)